MKVDCSYTQNLMTYVRPWCILHSCAGGWLPWLPDPVRRRPSSSSCVMPHEGRGWRPFCLVQYNSHLSWGKYYFQFSWKHVCCLCVCVCAFVIPSNHGRKCDILHSDHGCSENGDGPHPWELVQSVANQMQITLKNYENLCAPVTSPVISELSYSYTKRSRLHVVHRSVPTPIACSIRIVHTVFHTVLDWEGLQVCVCVLFVCVCVFGEGKKVLTYFAL